MSEPPRRLVDDPTLPEELRRDLRAAAEAPYPPVDPSAASRLSEALQSEAATAAGAATTQLLARLWPWLGAVGAVALVTGAVWLLDRPAPDSDVAAAPAEPPSAEPPPVRAPEEPPAENAVPSPAEPQEDDVAAAGPEEPPLSSEPAAARPRPRPRPDGPDRADVDPTTAEMLLVARARGLLPTRPAGALRSLREADRRFPQGMFVQERRALHVEALFRLGRSNEARRRARAFIREYPHSPFAERLRQLTTEEGAGTAAHGGLEP